MRRIYLLIILLISVLSVQAQDLAGRKIIQGSVRFNINSNEYSSTNSSTLSLKYGKIKENNTYLAWGGSLLFNGSTINNENTSQFRIGPSVEYGKFVPIIDRLYLAPSFGGNIQAVLGNAEGISLNAYASPLRFLYDFSNHFMLSASLGSASLQFEQVHKTTRFLLDGSLTNNTSLGVFYTFK